MGRSQRLVKKVSQDKIKEINPNTVSENLENRSFAQSLSSNACERDLSVD